MPTKRAQRVEVGIIGLLATLNCPAFALVVLLWALVLKLKTVVTVYFLHQYDFGPLVLGCCFEILS